MMEVNDGTTTHLLTEVPLFAGRQNTEKLYNSRLSNKRGITSGRADV